MSLHSLCLMMLPCILEPSSTTTLDPKSAASHFNNLGNLLVALVRFVARGMDFSPSFFVAANALCLIGERKLS